MSYEQFLNLLFDAIVLRGLQIIDFHVSFNGYGMQERDTWSMQLLYVKSGDATMTGKLINHWNHDLEKLLEQVKAKIDELEQPKTTSNLLIVP